MSVEERTIQAHDVMFDCDIPSHLLELLSSFHVVAYTLSALVRNVHHDNGQFITKAVLEAIFALVSSWCNDSWTCRV